MSTTLNQLFSNVLLEMNADANTTLFQLYSGADSTTATMTTTQTMIKLYNDACSDLARNAFLISGNATYSSLPIGTLSVSLDAPGFTSADGSTLWHAQTATWNGNAVNTCGRSRAELQYPGFVNIPTGNVKYWFMDGANSVMIIPRPSSAQNFTVYGLVVPPVVPLTAATTPTVITGATNASPIAVTMAGHGFVSGMQVNIAGAVGNTAANGNWMITVTGANTFTLNGSTGNGAWTSGGTVSALAVGFPDHVWKTIEAYICASLADKRVDDGSMAERTAFWSQRYMDDKIRFYNVAWDTNPDLANQCLPKKLVWRGREYNR